MTPVTPYLDFDYRALTGAFDPAEAVVEPRGLHYGLAHQLEYVHGFVTLDNGTTIWLEHKFVGALSSGTFVQTDADGSFRMHGGTPRTQRGEVRRTRDGVARRWYDPIMKKLPEGVRQTSDLDFNLEIAGRDFAWSAGDLYDLRGRSDVLGVQFLCASENGSILYSSVSFKVSGTFEGSPVNGYIQNDHIYLPVGLEWKETPFFLDKQVAWNIFSNEFDDGTREYGHLIAGRHGFNLAAVVENDRIRTATADLGGKFRIADSGFAEKVVFAADNTDWEFDGNPRGDMVEFSQGRWGGYQAQVGVTRRRGDDRKRVGGFSFMDGFLTRITDEQRLA